MTLIWDTRSPLHQSIERMHPLVACGLCRGLGGLSHRESFQSRSEVRTGNESLKLRHVASVVRYERRHVTAQKLNSMVAVNAVFGGLACAGDANAAAGAFGADVIDVALRSLHPETQHLRYPKHGPYLL